MPSNRTIVLFVVALICVACSSTATSPVFARTEPMLTGDDQLTSGPVTYEDGCLYLNGTQVIVWQTGTTWQAQPPAVRFTNGETFEVPFLIEDTTGTDIELDFAAEFVGPDLELDRLSECLRDEGLIVLDDIWSEGGSVSEIQD